MFTIEKDYNIRTVPSEFITFASLLFDQGSQKRPNYSAI